MLPDPSDSRTDVKVKMTYSQVQWTILRICALHLPIQGAHTPWTHTRSSGQPREQLESHLSRGIEGGERALYSHSSTYNSCRPETRTHNLCISSSSSPLLSLVQVPAKLAINLSIHTQHTYDNGVDRTGDRVFRKYSFLHEEREEEKKNF